MVKRFKWTYGLYDVLDLCYQHRSAVLINITFDWECPPPSPLGKRPHFLLRHCIIHLQNMATRISGKNVTQNCCCYSDRIQDVKMIKTAKCCMGRVSPCDRPQHWVIRLCRGQTQYTLHRQPLLVLFHTQNILLLSTKDVWSAVLVVSFTNSIFFLFT